MRGRLLLVGAVLLVCGAHAASSEEVPVTGTGRITVVFSGCESDEGRALVALIDSEAAWEDEGRAFREARPTLAAGEARATFDDVPFGSYAVKVFHDENGNGELDANWIGMPREAFGFSNDAMGRFGPPGFDAARFELEDEELLLEIQARRL